MGLINNMNTLANQKSARELTRLRKASESQPPPKAPSPPAASLQSQMLEQMRYQSEQMQFQSTVLAEIRDLLADQQQAP